jgi:hypothetical protein
MRRFLFISAASGHPNRVPFALIGLLTTAAALLVVGACTSTETSDSAFSTDDSGTRKDGGLVGLADGGTYDSGTPTGPEPSCTTYCDLVTASCTGDQAQYASRAECLEVCTRLPAGDAGDIESNTVACRQYYAGSPARTNAGGYCLAAGPFGGGVCGDRCIAFCGLTLGACSADAAAAPYGSYPDCQTACAGYAYKDGGADGGGEPPTGPASGDTLNCRLFHLRAAVHDGSGCGNLGADSGACR